MLNLRSFFTLFAAASLALVVGGNLAWAADEKEEDKIPVPEDIVLETKDGVALHCTYYGGFLEKNAVPFLMIHGWDGNRGEYDGLAKEMQKRGLASLTVDLRGHGDSVGFKDKGNTRVIDRTKFTGKDVESMLFDLEAAKKYLVDRNNEGKLNIDLLCVVGAKEGGMLALRWAVADWSVTELPTLRQGHDVKAVFLLTPVLAFKGVSAQQVLTHPALRESLSVFIACGKRDVKGLPDAKTLYTKLSQYRKEASGDAADVQLILDESPKAKKRIEVFFDQDDTNLFGTKLVGVQGLKVFGWMLRFIKLEVIDRADEFKWEERRRL